MTLLRESRANHLGKLAFRHIYWNVLLPGRPLGLPAEMSMTGKVPVVTASRRAVTMPTTTIAGHDVDVNDEGFLTRPDQWDDRSAPSSPGSSASS